MVVHRKRHVPGAIEFNAGGCQLACCNPSARRELTTVRRPLPPESRLAFLLVVRRLGAGALPGLRTLPQDVLRHIFALSETTERKLISVAPLPGLPQHARGAPTDDDLGMLCGLSLDGAPA